jgi:hypothetical protein
LAQPLSWNLRISSMPALKPRKKSPRPRACTQAFYTGSCERWLVTVSLLSERLGPFAPNTQVGRPSEGCPVFCLGHGPADNQALGGADLDGAGPQHPQGTPAFDHVHGMQLFDYFNKHPDELELFAEAMRSFSVVTGAAVAETYDFSGSAPWRILEGARDSFCLWFAEVSGHARPFSSICRRWLKVLRALSRGTA